MKLKLHKQEKHYSCSVACLRMVLEYYGIHENEITLREKSKTKFYGTHPFNIVNCAESYGFKASIVSLTLKGLEELINQNIPVITNILKSDGDDFYIHSLVAYKMEKDIIYLMDPEDGEIHLQCKVFERLWQGTGCASIIIEAY